MSVEEVARSFADRIDDRDWAGLAALLAPDFRGDYRHDGLITELVEVWTDDIPTSEETP